MFYVPWTAARTNLRTEGLLAAYAAQEAGFSCR